MSTKHEAASPSHNIKRTLAVVLTLGLIGSSVLLALGGPTGVAARPGFLGTRANLFSDMNLVAQFVLLAGLSVGAVLARRGNIAAHQYNQTAWVLFNVVLTIFIMAVAFFEYIAPGLPGNFGQAYVVASTIHAALGSLTILCGIYLLLRMNRRLPRSLRISWWKGLMRLTFVLYWIVGLIGLAVYYFWYVR